MALASARERVQIGPVIGASQAASEARRYLARILSAADPMTRPWARGELGEPLLVRTVEREPSFWIVPVLGAGVVLGTIEVNLDRQVLGHSYFYRHPDELDECPTAATRLTGEEARAEAAGTLRQHAGREVSDPVFVHDGPRSRVTWMIEVRAAGELVSRVFVTPGYTLERRGEALRRRPGERGD